MASSPETWDWSSKQSCWNLELIFLIFFMGSIEIVQENMWHSPVPSKKVPVNLLTFLLTFHWYSCKIFPGILVEFWWVFRWHCGNYRSSEIFLEPAERVRELSVVWSFWYIWWMMWLVEGGDSYLDRRKLRSFQFGGQYQKEKKKRKENRVEKHDYSASSVRDVLSSVERRRLDHCLIS